MRSVSVKCDVCGTQKQETNHWLYVNYRILERHESIEFSVEAGENKLCLDICGDECAHKLLSQWLTGLKSSRDALQGTKPCVSIADESCGKSTP